MLRLFIVQGMSSPLIGMILGLGISIGVTRLLAGLLVGVSPLDPFTFLAVLVLLSTVTLVANFLPARRAARLDPTVTLRAE